MTAGALVVFFWPADQMPELGGMFSYALVLHAGIFFVLTITWLRTGLSNGRVLAIVVGLIVDMAMS